MDIKEAIRLLRIAQITHIKLSLPIHIALREIETNSILLTKTESLKLHIIDLGDKENGMPECEYVVDCPFGTDADDSILDDFAQRMRHTYREYSNGRIRTHYSNGYKPG